MHPIVTELCYYFSSCLCWCRCFEYYCWWRWWWSGMVYGQLEHAQNRTLFVDCIRKESKVVVTPLIDSFFSWFCQNFHDSTQLGAVPFSHHHHLIQKIQIYKLLCTALTRYHVMWRTEWRGRLKWKSSFQWIQNYRKETIEMMRRIFYFCALSCSPTASLFKRWSKLMYCLHPSCYIVGCYLVQAVMYNRHLIVTQKRAKMYR